MTSPEKSVLREAEALLKHVGCHVDNCGYGRCEACDKIRRILAEQHRLKAENRSLREALRDKDDSTQAIVRQYRDKVGQLEGENAELRFRQEKP